MKKSIRKSENWQDFESLCRKLWSEVYKSDFKKNGRNGQKQKGVDVYGVPEGKTGYYGIQCKHKTISEKITEGEIDQEITNAKEFKPALQMLIFATTAPKDVAVEEYVRLKDTANREKGAFGVLIYCWEDIEDLLSENYLTYQWYMNNLDVQQRQDVGVSFEDNSCETIIHPTYLRKRIVRSYDPPRLGLHTSQLALAVQAVRGFESRSYARMFSRSRSWCDLKIKMLNNGSGVLDHWKMIVSVSACEGRFDDSPNPISVYPTQEFKLYCDHAIVQGEKRHLSIRIQPLLNIEKISLRWAFLAKDYSREGILTVLNQPIMVDRVEAVSVKSMDEEGIAETIEEWYGEQG